MSCHVVLYGDFLLRLERERERERAVGMWLDGGTGGGGELDMCAFNLNGFELILYFTICCCWDGMKVDLFILFSLTSLHHVTLSASFSLHAGHTSRRVVFRIVQSLVLSNGTRFL